MDFKRTAGRAVATMAAAVALVGLSGAGQAVASDDLGTLGNAPTCVKVSSSKGIATQTGKATNNCGRSLNLKIIWAFGADGPCSTVANGKSITNKVAIQPRVFDGASTC
ncbi:MULTISPECIES: hypothetical protein [Actinosynnema]|uniref:hypothetical protein n=1 Tax=Actinosynnema TaxID=40566 RepID=UPI0020A378F2|nr:hypothetical protein [Actinosynnema pretiosum]MCP2097790.1 hypothetical protein [Actinosynnema pretiosum]